LPNAGIAVHSCAFFVAHALGIVLGAASLVVRPNWRGGLGIAIGAVWLVALPSFRWLLGDLPDR
jgi:hypothetical protein